MKRATILLALPLLAACSVQQQPTDSIDQNIARTQAGAFGKCLEYSYLAGNHLQNAKFYREKVKTQDPSSREVLYGKASSYSEGALDMRRKAEEACQQYHSMFMASRPVPQNMAANKPSALLKEQVFFDLGSSQIRSTERNKLKEIVKLYRSTPGAEVLIIGHTDSTGSRNYNQALSTRRAVSVFEELKKIAGDIKISMPPERIDMMGQGEVPGPNNQKVQAHRRVDILVVPSKERS